MWEYLSNQEGNIRIISAKLPILIELRQIVRPNNIKAHNTFGSCSGIYGARYLLNVAEET